MVAIGALIDVLLIAVLDMEIHVHLLLGSALSLFLGLVIFLIAAMDNPFRGEVSVGPEAFEAAYETLMKPNDAISKAMPDLITQMGKLGFPRIEGKENVAGKEVPGLYFGATGVNNVFEIVDQVVRENGGTATLFVKSDNAYVRVATNVRKSDGSRAIGTILDPKGPVIGMIRKGKAFYGDASILGKPYTTGYEPITDASNNVIGIYYVSCKK